MKKILVVVDMQNDFVDGALGSKEAVSIVDNVCKKIEKFDGDGEIFVTLDTHDNNYLDTYEGKNLPVPHCIKMTQGWMLNEKVYNALSKKSYKLLEKSTFASEDLLAEVMFENPEYTEIEVCGLCSDICVISNALVLRKEHPDMKIIVDASCCAGVTPEKHKAAMEVMKSCQITVIGE